MMRKPDINDYPKWLHSHIQEPMARSTGAEEQNCQNELLVIYDESRRNPLAKVLFAMVIEIIRMQFQMWSLYQRVLKAEERRFIPGNFTKEEIQALKACAKQKMSESTPEEEASWEEALDDPWGGS
jgi:hypothetical protein